MSYINIMSYRSTCPVASFLDIAGDRWSLLIVRELFVGRKTYSEMLHMPESIATNILVDRLKKLQDHQIIGMIKMPNNSKTKHYYLTEKGVDLYSVMCEMSLWTRKHLQGIEVHPLGLAQWKSFDEIGIEGTKKVVTASYRQSRSELLKRE